MKKITLLFIMTAVLGTMGCSKKDEEGPDDGPPAGSPSGPPTGSPSGTPRTEVPDELVGAWDDGSLDFALWENYRQGYWAGRNAAPTREAMVFQKNGDAKFYRYEFLYNFYEELIDCEGTVTFNGDGTFTFYPVKGRMRYYETRDPSRNKDRPLTSSELTQPKLAGTRGYTYIPSSTPPTIQITVPGSAPYKWYKKE